MADKTEETPPEAEQLPAEPEEEEPKPTIEGRIENDLVVADFTLSPGGYVAVLSHEGSTVVVAPKGDGSVILGPAATKGVLSLLDSDGNSLAVGKI